MTAINSASCNSLEGGDDCILWGVSSVNFGVAMFLCAVLLLSSCFNLVLFALLSLLFRALGKEAWIPILHHLISSTLWFLRFGCAFGIFSLLAPERDYAIAVENDALILAFYVCAVPFCISLLYWTNRVCVVAIRIILEEDAARFSEAQARAAKMSPFTTIDYAASATARQASIFQMLTLMRYCFVLLMLWVGFRILGIEVGVLLKATNFLCLVFIIPLVQSFRSFSLGALWLFIFDKDEWSIGFSPGNVVWFEDEVFVTRKCMLRAQTMLSESSYGGALMHLPHSHFSDRLGSSNNGRRKIRTPFQIQLKLRREASTEAISRMVDKLDLYLSTIHSDLSTSFASIDSYLLGTGGGGSSSGGAGGGRISFNCQAWALDVNIFQVWSTFGSEASLYGEIVLGMIETLGDMHLPDSQHITDQQQQEEDCDASSICQNDYAYYALELPVQYL